MKGKLGTYLQILRQELRPQTYALFALFVCVGFCLVWLGWQESNFFAQTQLPKQGWVLVVALTMLASWYIMAVTVNDMADFEVDAVNLPGAHDRPLQNGVATKQQLTIVACVMAILVIICSAVLGPRVVVMGAVVIGLALAYSLPPLQLSHRGVIAPVLLPLGYVVFPILIAPLHYEVAPTLPYMLLTGGLYLVFAGRVMLKDYRDKKGDALHGKKTFLLQVGHRRTTLTSLVVALAGTGLVAGSLYWATGLVIPSAIIVLQGLLTIKYYYMVLKTTAWLKIRPVLPLLGRLLSLQTVVLFVAMLYATESIPLLPYVGLLFLALCGTYRAMLRPR